MSNTDNPDASVLKRLFALVYDGLLLVALDMVVVLLPASFLITFKGLDTSAPAYSLLMVLAIVLVHGLFYGWFWTHGGQTLGMKSWRLKLTTVDQGSVGWSQALKRFVIGIPAWLLLLAGVLNLLALGSALKSALIVFALLWWVLDNRAGLWRERYSGTRIIQLPKH